MWINWPKFFQISDLGQILTGFRDLPVRKSLGKFRKSEIFEKSLASKWDFLGMRTWNSMKFVFLDKYRLVLTIFMVFENFGNFRGHLPPSSKSKFCEIAIHIPNKGIDGTCREGVLMSDHDQFDFDSQRGAGFYSFDSTYRQPNHSFTGKLCSETARSRYIWRQAGYWPCYSHSQLWRFFLILMFLCLFFSSRFIPFLLCFQQILSLFRSI